MWNTSQKTLCSVSDHFIGSTKYVMKIKNSIACEINKFKFLGLAVIGVQKKSNFKNNFWNKIMCGLIMWNNVSGTLCDKRIPR